MKFRIWAPNQLVDFGELLDDRFRGNYLKSVPKEENITIDASEGSYGLVVFL